MLKEGASTREMLSYAADVIARTAGTGTPEISAKTGARNKKESMALPADVEAVDGRTGKRVYGGKIHYGDKFVHIVPKYDGGGGAR